MESMASFILLMILCPFALPADLAEVNCNKSHREIPGEWKTLGSLCSHALEEQIHHELAASLTYLGMGAFFSRDIANRLGFSELFFDKATKGRETAIEIINYLIMRGQPLNDLKFPDKLDQLMARKASEALENSLAIETRGLKILQRALATCDDQRDENGAHKEDYNVRNYFGGDFLGRKLGHLKKLAEMIWTLKAMEDNHDAVGEFLYDEKLLEGEV